MRIHSFESLAALDGEGLRYGIFLVGCPLRCVYCHNPDTWNTQGTEHNSQQLLKRILRYKPYFGSNGGVTFSGGEPLLQAKEIAELGAMLRSEGIGYTLDTCGAVELTDDVKAAIDGSELVICDLKFPNEEDFFRYTKGDFSKVLRFLDYLKSKGKKTWIRTVIVPGINDNERAIETYAKLVLQYPNVVKYELLGFHTMGFFKYEKLQIDNPLKDTEPLDKERLAKLQRIADSTLNP